MLNAYKQRFNILATAKVCWIDCLHCRKLFAKTILFEYLSLCHLLNKSWAYARSDCIFNAYKKSLYLSWCPERRAADTERRGIIYISGPIHTQVVDSVRRWMRDSYPHSLARVPAVTTGRPTHTPTPGPERGNSRKGQRVLRGWIRTEMMNMLHCYTYYWSIIGRFV